MKAKISIRGKKYKVDLSRPYDISIPLKASKDNPLAWYLKPAEITPVEVEDWVGSVKEGAAVNFYNIWFNPHAHGTHTECLGHISADFHSVNDSLRQYFFSAELVSVAPETRGDDQVITLNQLKELLGGKSPEALIIRTLPNSSDKLFKDYSNTNWPHLEAPAAEYLKDLGVDHLLIDLPSVDKEKDDGELLAHRAFWNFPDKPRMHATITEFVYVKDEVKDGSYLLSLQVAPFHNDAAPSRPVLYKIK